MEFAFKRKKHIFDFDIVIGCESYYTETTQKLNKGDISALFE
jgi:hypothetical protein